MHARCTVEAPDGTELDMIFVARIPHGRAAAHDYLFAEGPNRAVPDLPPGRYRLRVYSAGFAPAELLVDVAAGRTTERVIELRPE